MQVIPEGEGPVLTGQCGLISRGCGGPRWPLVAEALPGFKEAEKVAPKLGAGARAGIGAAGGRSGQREVTEVARTEALGADST